MRMPKIPEYAIWQSMKHRCKNLNTRATRYWGDRGIKVCDRWSSSFEAFLNDVGLRPSKQYALHRPDNSRDYEPGNAQWVLKSENAKSVRQRKDYTGLRLKRRLKTANERRRSFKASYNLTQCLLDRFWKCVDKRHGRGCWMWTGPVNSSGYGMIRVNEKRTNICRAWLAHRLSYYIANGPIKFNLLVCHLCNNRLCVKPNHLRLGTYSTNNIGNVRGEKHGLSKLSNNNVNKIRSLYKATDMTQQQLADKYGVSVATIHSIIKNKHRIDRNYNIPHYTKTRKFTSKQAEYIRSKWAKGYSMISLARQFAVSCSIISDVIHGRRCYNLHNFLPDIGFLPNIKDKDLKKIEERMQNPDDFEIATIYS